MINQITCTSKILIDLCFTKQSKNKKWFCRSCLLCFSNENVLTKHKEDCLIYNGKQSVKLEEGIIESENYFKQIPVPFKIYADFECNLRGVESYEGSYTKKYQDHVPCSFAYKEEEHLFQQSNSCWICKKLIDNDDEKVRDHCHVTGKFRGAAHGSCNINLQSSKKVPVIFHSLRGYDSHLIFC